MSQTCRQNGDNGQRISATQVRLAPYPLAGEHVNSPEPGVQTHVENLQHAVEDLDKEATRAVNDAGGYTLHRFERAGLVEGGAVGEPYLAEDGVFVTPIWFNKFDCEVISLGGTAPFIPAGSISTWPSDYKVPDGWLEADGRLVSSVVYKDLFDILCYTYGGNASGSHFRLPDLRCKGLLGVPYQGMYSHIVNQRFQAAAPTGTETWVKVNSPASLTPGTWRESDEIAKAGEQTVSRTDNRLKLHVRYIIKFKNDLPDFIKDVEWVEGTAFAGELKNAIVTLKYPPRSDCPAPAAHQWEYQILGVNTIANAWQNPIKSNNNSQTVNATIHVAGDNDQGTSNTAGPEYRMTATIARPNSDDSRSGDTFIVSRGRAYNKRWPSAQGGGARYIDMYAQLSFDVPRGWYWRVDTTAGGSNKGAMCITKKR